MSDVVVAGVTKSFGTTPVLNGIDLHIGDGEVIALLGPSGGGKTTLLRIVAGLEEVDDGEVIIGSRTVSGSTIHVPPEARRVGLVFQNGALFPHISVAGNVGYGLARGERRAGPRIDELLGVVGLAGTGERRTDQLSGGQQQRIALARALAPEPEVLLLDEPFSNLDVGLREHLRREVHRIIRELGMTSIFVTHDQAEAFAIGDRVAVLADGVLVQVDTPVDLYRRPADRWVASFVGAGSLVPGESDGVSAMTELGRLELVAGSARGPVDVLVRPEQVRVTPAVGRAASGSGTVAAVVDRVEFAGPTTSVEVVVGERRVVARVLGTPGLAVGSRVELAVVGPSVAYPKGDGPEA